jgi:hypothetical protein
VGQRIFGAFADLITNPGNRDMPSSRQFLAIDELAGFDSLRTGVGSELFIFIEGLRERLLRRDVSG